MDLKYKPSSFRQSAKGLYRSLMLKLVRFSLGFALFLYIFYNLSNWGLEYAAQHLSLEHEEKIASLLQTPKTKHVESKAYWERAHRILERINKEKLHKYPYRIYIDQNPEIHAYSVIGGGIVLTTGLMDAFKDDEALLFILAHEVAHLHQRHHIKHAFLSTYLSYVPEKLLKHLTFLGHSSKERIEADKQAFELLNEATGSHKGAVRFFKRLHRLWKDDALKRFLILHPEPKKRVEQLQKM